MKRLMITAASVAALAGCATPAAEDFGFWQRNEAFKPSRIEVQDTQYMNAWCPRFPFALGCTMLDYSANVCVVFLRAGLSEDLKQDVLEHEKCHCLGFVHQTMAAGEGARYSDPFDGMRPDKCPAAAALPIVQLDPL